MEMDSSSKSSNLEGGLGIKNEKLEEGDGSFPKYNVEKNLKDCVKQPSLSADFTPDSSNSSQEDSNTLKRKQSPQDEPVHKKARVSSINQVEEYDSLTERALYFMITSTALKDETIMKYLKEHKVTIEDKTGSGSEKHLIRLKFQNAAEGKKIFKHLYEQGRKATNLLEKKLISLKLIDNTLIATRVSLKESQNVDVKETTTKDLSQSLFVPEEEDNGGPLGLYGLKPDFLKSLGITPPINNWVTVSNARCDKFELRDIMEMAGKVLSCSITNVLKKIAKVQYSHPLEAVQAVSMLNDQMYFGLKLEVCMDKVSKNQIVLPNGLYNIGPGLGFNGKPLRDVAQQYKKFANQQKCSLNPKMFCKNIYEIDNVKYESELDISENGSPASVPTLNIRHAEDIDSNDGDRSEKSLKRFKSPTFDCGSSDSNNETEEARNSNDLQKISTINRNNSRPDTSGSFPGPNTSQNLPVRCQMFPSAPFRPSGPQTQFDNQFPGPFQPDSPCIPMSSNVPNNMHNQRPSGPYGPSPPFGPQTTGPNGPRPGQMGVPGPYRPNVPNTVSGSGPMRVPGPAQGPGPVCGSIAGPGPIRGPGPMGPGKVLQFANLPPSTTFPSFCEKLSRCGQVMSLQFTTPGCAVVTFAHPSHAERCFQSYNGITVEGFRILVTFI